MRLYRYYVAGCGLFPFKMLARDHAWPASEKDAALIELACPTQAPRQVIGLASHERPSINRWKDENWPVERVDA
jgi:hypothetical protein